MTRMQRAVHVANVARQRTLVASFAGLPKRSKMG
jgi:hypothetical protein